MALPKIVDKGDCRKDVTAFFGEYFRFPITVLGLDCKPLDLTEFPNRYVAFTIYDKDTNASLYVDRKWFLGSEAFLNITDEESPEKGELIFEWCNTDQGSRLGAWSDIVVGKYCYRVNLVTSNTTPNPDSTNSAECQRTLCYGELCILDVRDC